MRLLSIIMGGFLLFLSIFVLRDFLTEDETVNSHREVNVEANDTKMEDPVEDEAFMSSASKQPVIQITPYNSREIDQSYSEGKSVYQPSQDELENHRMIEKEQRIAILAERQMYKNARSEWRKALNEAHEEAVKSGDYTKYESLKRREPTKNKQPE